MEERVEVVDGEETEELLRTLQQGDPEAGERLWQLVQRHATGELRRRGVRQQEQLLELLHAVLESVQRRASQPGWRPRSNLVGFLKGRARGVFSVWAREQRRMRMTGRMERLPAGLDGLPGGGESPDEAAARADERNALGERIRHCRDKLGGRLYRPVWSLRYEAGLDLAEIASRLGRPYVTVAVHAYRANLKMRDCIRAGGFDPWSSA